jgi:hypothetical protein
MGGQCYDFKNIFVIKNLTILTQNTVILVAKIDHDIGFQEKKTFSAENW